MKLFTLLMLACCLHVTADVRAQKIDLRVERASLKSVLLEISRQSGYAFIYTDEQLSKARPITVTLDKTPLREALPQIFAGQPFDYAINDKVVSLREKQVKLEKRLVPLLQDTIRGTVTDSLGKPLAGVSVKIVGTNKGTTTNTQGRFQFNEIPENAKLAFHSLGYSDAELPPSAYMLVQLSAALGGLEEVVVSTGYQSIPKERSTGSFDFIDNKTYNRAVSTDILERLKGVGNGLLFDFNTGNGLGISVRGRSTIFSDTQPLIVIDNFPYEGDLSSINPNDVEDVSILKDAAAASIWGTRAGNGVIVITTKRGQLNRKPTININSNVTVHAKPDLHYQPHLSPSEFIEIETELFRQSWYDWTTTDGFSVISPVVQALYDQQRGLISEGEAQARIQEISQGDILADMEKYLYRNGLNQQHQVNISGGGDDQTYYLSAGIDHNNASERGQGYQRVTLKAVNSFNFLKNKLKLTTDVNFISTESRNSSNFGVPHLPYQQLAGASGNPLPVTRIGGLREAYTDTAGAGYLLDWKYRPLEELNNKSQTYSEKLNNYLVNVNASYRIIEQLSISAYYQFNRQNTNASTLYAQESFYTRNLINSFSQINYSTGEVTRPIPLGDIMSSSVDGYHADYGRLQLNFNKLFGNHRMEAIAGYELREERSNRNNNGYYYGYDPATETYQNPMDYITRFPRYYGFGQQTIPNTYGRSSTTYRNISYYANVGYTFSDRYLLNASIRKDESNLFGVSSNQRGVPLWSVGTGWNVHEEAFFDLPWLPYLKLRATYGYNGNVDRNASAYLTSMRYSISPWQNPYDIIVNPSNPQLHWERVKNINFGLDYGLLANSRISGSMEYYVKNGKDLMGYGPIAPQTGLSNFYGNVADTRTHGMDIRVSSHNIIGRNFRWDTDVLINLAKDKVKNYLAEAGTNGNVVAPLSINPIEGYPINSLASYRYAGLNELGDPVGYLNGEESVDYTSIINSYDRNLLAFHGSRTPIWFGSVRNTFGLGPFELSFNIMFKGGYYFRRSSVSSAWATGNSWLNLTDYAERWQNPGDENRTMVPAFKYPLDFGRSDFYHRTAYLTEKGDHIRLQDFQLNYQVFESRKGISDLNIYIYANNLGVLWKANKAGLDPEFQTGYPTPRSIALGVNVKF